MNHGLILLLALINELYEFAEELLEEEVGPSRKERLQLSYLFFTDQLAKVK